MKRLPQFFPAASDQVHGGQQPGSGLGNLSNLLRVSGEGRHAL